MLVKLALCHAKIEKVSNNIFVMIIKDGGDNFGFYGGDTTVVRGDRDLMGGPPVPPPLGKTL